LCTVTHRHCSNVFRSRQHQYGVTGAATTSPYVPRNVALSLFFDRPLIGSLVNEKRKGWSIRRSASSPNESFCLDLGISGWYRRSLSSRRVHRPQMARFIAKQLQHRPSSSTIVSVRSVAEPHPLSQDSLTPRVRSTRATRLQWLGDVAIKVERA
jgi:hypothetical protein